jgi:ABC-2 type transport system ATP-binding protein
MTSSVGAEKEPQGDPIVTKETILKATDLTKRFGDFTAVDHVSFEVHRGEVFGLLGHNGAGKTTIVNMLAGLMLPTEGTASVSGYDIREKPLDARRRIGLLPDNPGNYLHLTAKQNLEFFAELADLKKDVAKERIAGLLELVGLTEWRDRKVEHYSRGMKQRLGLAQSLVRDPDMLFFDEPTLGIDPEGTRQIRGLIRRLAGEGKAILICSHLLNEVSRVCDRVAIMRRGKIIAMGTLPELREKLGLGDQIELEDIFIQVHGEAGVAGDSDHR